MRRLALLLILASGCSREPAPTVPQLAEPKGADEIPPALATESASVSADAAPTPTGKPPGGCQLAGRWTMKVTRKVPLANPPKDPSPCEVGTFPDYTLEVGPYPADHDPLGYLFPGERKRPALLGENADKGAFALPHNMGVLNLKEVAGTCEARIILSASQGHSVFDATYEIRVDNGEIQGEGKWEWGTDLPEGVEECPAGGCSCEVDVKVAGTIVVPG